MIKAKTSDKKLICGLLTSSFTENPSVRYIISGATRRPRRIVALMDYSFELCMRFGEVWLSDDRNGCVLLLFPQNKRVSLARVWLDLKLAFTAIGLSRIGGVLRRQRLIAERQPKRDGAYLLFIGVKPTYQKTGVGTALLNDVLHRMAVLGLPVYLETSVPENLPWYKKFGFGIYDQIDLGYRLFLLART